MSEGDGGEAERGQVGQADAGGEVDRGDQAAQQDREQHADDGQYQRYDKVEIGGGVVADVVRGGVLAGDAGVVGARRPAGGVQAGAHARNGCDGGRGARGSCGGQGGELDGMPVGGDELGGGSVRLVDAWRDGCAGRWRGGKCLGGAELGVQAGQVVGGQWGAVGVQWSGQYMYVGCRGELLLGGLQAGRVGPDRGGEVQQQTVGVGGGGEVRGDGGGAGGRGGAGWGVCA